MKGGEEGREGKLVRKINEKKCYQIKYKDRVSIAKYWPRSRHTGSLKRLTRVRIISLGNSSADYIRQREVTAWTALLFLHVCLWEHVHNLTVAVWTLPLQPYPANSETGNNWCLLQLQSGSTVKVHVIGSYQWLGHGPTEDATVH